MTGYYKTYKLVTKRFMINKACQKKNCIDWITVGQEKKWLS